MEGFNQDEMKILNHFLGMLDEQIDEELDYISIEGSEKRYPVMMLNLQNFKNTCARRIISTLMGLKNKGIINFSYEKRLFIIWFLDHGKILKEWKDWNQQNLNEILTTYRNS